MEKHALELDQAALRAVIDAVAMIRAQSARLSFAALVAAAEGEAAALPEVAAARAAVAEGLRLVAGDAPVEDHAPVNVGWLRGVAAGEAGLIERFRAFDALAGDLLDATRDGRVTTALAQRVVTAGADDFYAATTRLMVLLWTDLETRRGEFGRRRPHRDRGGGRGVPRPRRARLARPPPRAQRPDRGRARQGGGLRRDRDRNRRDGRRHRRPRRGRGPDAGGGARAALRGGGPWRRAGAGRGADRAEPHDGSGRAPGGSTGTARRGGPPAGWIARTAPWGGPSTEDGPVAAAATDGGPGRFPGRDVGSAASDGPSSRPMPSAIGRRVPRSPPRGRRRRGGGRCFHGSGNETQEFSMAAASGRTVGSCPGDVDGNVNGTAPDALRPPRAPAFTVTRATSMRGAPEPADARSSPVMSPRGIGPDGRASRHPVRGHDGIRAAAPSGRPKPEPGASAGLRGRAHRPPGFAADAAEGLGRDGS